jgi:dTDP-4-dehydrorhamnose 3,5-epimerase/CDP-3, 6-dideoxy-D-glycero-D-glycero-4-hexulose-5-epimerase
MMIKLTTDLPDVYVLEPKIFNDERGQFIKVFNSKTFSDESLSFIVAESYYSISHKDVIRGMHFQTPPAAHAKLVYVTRGSIADVILDIRKDSPTYGKYISIALSAENRRMVYIPEGFAHGFMSHENETCVVYLQTTGYSPESDGGIKFDSFGMDWGIADPIVSSRDKGFPGLEQFITPFTYQKNEVVEL